MRAVSDELIICTDDGSYGRKCLVYRSVEGNAGIKEREHRAYWAIGPAIMMKFVAATTKPFNAPTTVQP